MTTTRIRTYSELRRLTNLEDRFNYLALHERVGRATFGFDRWINQEFYRSRQWKNIRHHVIARDSACDLGLEGYEIHTNLYIHHLNPMRPQDIIGDDESILDPEFLITTTFRTHNAIHFGDKDLLPRPFIPRRPGDTKLW